MSDRHEGGDEASEKAGVEEGNRAPRDFIRDRIAQDLQAGVHARVVTRFPPEPNGYLHIGHAKAICLNFGVAEEFGGQCHLRFDDTNPEKEDTEFVDAIEADVRWLGFDWGEHLYYASDYFERLYEFALELIRAGKAYVDSQSADQIRATRGTLTEPGTPGPFRNRTVEENLDMFARMRAGEFEDGAHVLRAKIDLASGNINMRDPVLYRIRRAHHHRTGDAWCIYPMYDFTHSLSDALEDITHSLCSLEFEDHRPLYDWCIENTSVPGRPRQIEFARLAITQTMMSKRKLRRLVEEKVVAGWDDPRMPTLRGMRRRGFPPEAIRVFAREIGVAKANSTVEYSLLEHFVREHLNRWAPRVMAVLDPLKVVIENWPEGNVEMVEAINNPEDAEAGSRLLPFSGELFIERDDFMVDPPKKFFRLSPGAEVRLKHGYYITCREAITDPATGEITELRCTYDPQSGGGQTPDGRRVKGTLHWVSAAHAVPAEVRLYEPLFRSVTPDAVGDPLEDLAPDSLQTQDHALVEPGLATASIGTTVQFLRHGYFAVDPDSRPGHLVFNRTVSLKDTWAKVQRSSGTP